MAQPDPNEPPESLTVAAFSGMKNIVDPERLQPGELERATNIDLDDVGQARRRRGYTQRLSGTCHSVWTAPDGRLFVVRDGQLGLVDAGWNFTGLGSYVGMDHLSYAEAGGEIFFSSRTASGIVDADNGVSPWGANAAEATWLSPVTRPTETLGAIRGKLLGPPPLAHEIGYWRGRMWLASGNVLWATELYLYRYVDKTRTFFQFEGDITMIAPVDDGIYLGTDKGLYFLSGTLAELKREKLMSSRVVPGSKVFAPTSQTHPLAASQPMPESDSVLFVTDDGICVGVPGGRCYNLTQKSMMLPKADSGAGLFRVDSGVSAYVAALDSGGDPATNARIGDYVDASIVRAVDRGL